MGKQDEQTQQQWMGVESTKEIFTGIWRHYSLPLRWYKADQFPFQWFKKGGNEMRSVQEADHKPGSQKAF